MAYKGRHLWNQLPKDLKETNDSLLFKTKLKDQFFNNILPGGGVNTPSLLFFLHHPKTAQDIKLKLFDFKDTLLRHILQVKPVR